MMASALVHLGIDQTQLVQQPSMLITMIQCQRRHAANTNCWSVGPVPILKNRPVPIQSTVDRMWFRISTKICSNSTDIIAIRPYHSLSSQLVWLLFKMSVIVCLMNLFLCSHN